MALHQKTDPWRDCSPTNDGRRDALPARHFAGHSVDHPADLSQAMLQTLLQTMLQTISQAFAAYTRDAYLNATVPRR
jgi:hypothetical protein